MEPTDVLAHLKQIPMFQEHVEEEDELLRFVPFVRERRYRAGDVIFREDQVPDRTVVIIEGQVHLSRTAEGQRPAVEDLDDLGPGATLGRVRLEPGAFRQVKAQAVEDTHVVYLFFRDLVRVYQKSDYLREHLEGPLQPDTLVNTLGTVPLFQELNDRAGMLELYRMGQITHDQYFAGGEWIFRQGEVSDRLIQVLEGEVKLTSIDENGMLTEVGTLTAGDVAGETGLLVGDFHDVAATAQGYARIIYILRQEFAELLRERPHLNRKLNIPEDVIRLREVPEFDWLREDEWAITVVHRHWTRLIRQISVPLLFLVLLFPILAFLLVNESTAAFVFGILVAVLSLPLIGIIIYQYINWQDDIFVLTTQRIVHMERVWPFSTEREETTLENIQDIYELRPGILANVLDFGNLIAQTAGETVEIDMDYVARPGELRELISDQIARAKARSILRMRGEIRDLLARRLQTGETSDVEPPAPSRRETKPQPSLPVLIITSVWQYLFPPSWVRADEGDTIIWRRYWLPGAFRYSPALLPFLLSTVSGLFLLGNSVRNSLAGGLDRAPGLSGTIAGLQENGFFGWFVFWLFIETVLLGVLLWLVEDWRNDYFELTPSHVVLIHRQPLLLQKSRRQAPLDRLQNLGYEIPSIVARIFDYGNVYFETAGFEGRFMLDFVRHPEKVQKTISNRQYEYRQRQREIEARQRQREFVSWFTAYDDLHREMGTEAEVS